jgi:4-amino-4-deoxy-L-arabinose transferase-like glycosyltransferase
MPQWMRHVTIVLAVAGPLLFFRLGAARLWDRDEPRNARCAVEMLERGDWVVPTFNGELRTHKPVLLYWLMMSAYQVFGVSEFAARFWSATLSLGTVLCTYMLGRRLFSPSAGLWAACCLAPALMFQVASRAATPDATLIFLMTAALTALVYASFMRLIATAEQSPWGFAPLGWGGTIVVYGLLGLAILAKGPVGIVVPLAIAGVWMLTPTFIEGRGSLLARFRAAIASDKVLNAVVKLRPLLGLCIALLIAAPWYILVGERTDGEFLVGFFWEHNVRRATETMEGHRGPALFYYPVVLMAGFFPASLFLIPSLSEAYRTLKARGGAAGGLAFCLVWIIVVVGLFSLAKTKLPSYVTPCYPALALLVGYVLDGWATGRLAINTAWMRWSSAASAIVGLGVCVGVYFAAHRYVPGEEWLAAVGLTAIAGGVAAIVCERLRRPPAFAAGATLAGGALFSLLLFGFGPAAADGHRRMPPIAEGIGHDGERWAAYHCLEPSWVFYGQRPIAELGEAGDAGKFVRTPGNRLLVKARDLENLHEQLPPGTRVVDEFPLFLKGERVVVLTNSAESTAAEPKKTQSR